LWLKNDQIATCAPAFGKKKNGVLFRDSKFSELSYSSVQVSLIAAELILFSALYKLHDGRVCNIERYRQCVDFMGDFTIEQRNRYYSVLMALKFVIPGACF
jgi:hypothetical protein